MSDFIELGPGERIYASGTVREFSWAEHTARYNLPMPPAMAPGVAAPDRPALRRAGRKLLTETGRAARDNKIARRLERREEDRLLRELEKAKIALKKNERIQSEQTKRLAKAKRLENVQARGNNSIAIVKPAAATPLPATRYTCVGVPPLPGKTAVRIDLKTVIYVNDGADIGQAVINYKTKHGLV